MQTDEDYETWILDEGDRVIKLEQTGDDLSDVEQAIYDLWAIDYAVRNAGSIEALEDVRENAMSDLLGFAKANSMNVTENFLKAAGKVSDEIFCDIYYESFDEICKELKKQIMYT